MQKIAENRRNTQTQKTKNKKKQRGFALIAEKVYKDIQSKINMKSGLKMGGQRRNDRNYK